MRGCRGEGRENRKTREEGGNKTERERGTYGTIVSKFSVLRQVDRRKGRAREKEKKREMQSISRADRQTNGHCPCGKPSNTRQPANRHTDQQFDGRTDTQTDKNESQADSSESPEDRRADRLITDIACDLLQSLPLLLCTTM